MTLRMCASSRKTKGQVEDVELVDHRSHGADGDARDLQRADLGLLDHLLLAAQLHRRIHLDRDAPLGGGLQLLAHALDRLHGRIAERVHIARLPHHLLLRQQGARGKGRQGRRRANTDHVATLHFAVSSVWFF
jgi:hypothetical protein